MQTTIVDLLEAGVHFGHKTKRWNPKMKPYAYGTRNGITIFDLTVTMKQLAEACEYLRDVAVSGGQILFVGAKRQAQECVRGVAERLDMPFMCDRWLGGTLTNQKVVLSSVSKMKSLRAKIEDGSLDNLPKKEAAGFKRELEKLETTLGGIVNLKDLPAALVVVDITREHIAVKEASKLNIPIVALVDSNCSPELIDYVIPGNDDALRSIKVIMDTLAAAIADGLGISSKANETGPAPAKAAPAAASADNAAADDEAVAKDDDDDDDGDEDK